MFIEQKTAVLVHGCHLQADLNGRSWRTLVWGTEEAMPTLAGRVVMGVYVALCKNAELITFSTGASEKDGLKEAEYTFAMLMEHLSYIAPMLSNVLQQGIGVDWLRDWLSERAVLDTVSQNTVEETSANLALALERGCTEVIGVTNAFHAPRCLAGLQAARIKYDSPLLVSVVPAYDTDYGTVILEPPHRGDCPKTKWHLLGRRLFKIGAPDLPQFEDEFDGLLKRYCA